MKNNSYIQQIVSLNNQIEDRKKFHETAGQILIKMGRDKQFWFEVFRSNLTDNGYLNRQWTMYEIPFFYVHEIDDFNVKVHLFASLKSHQPGVVTSAIHHHNNYLLSTFAAYGSGYETILFDKHIEINPKTKETKLKIRDHFNSNKPQLVDFL